MPSCGCCVPGCTNRGGHRFPKNDELRRRWLIAIRRDEKPGKIWCPTPNSVVCSKHFLESDYIKFTCEGALSLKKQLKGSAVPSIFAWRQKGLQSCTSTGALRSGKEYAALNTACQPMKSIEELVPSLECDEAVIEVKPESGNSSDEETHTSNSCPLVHTASQTPSYPMFSIENFIDDKQGIEFYTGLASYQDFLFVLQTLGDAAYYLNYMYSQVESISVPNQFFMTLIKLRQYKPNFELSRLFGVSELSVYNIVITWVNFMSCQWREIDLWPERDLVRYFSPTDLSRKFPTTRIIIDGTECPIKKPRPPIAQQSTFSTYKNRNTVKILVGSTPGGLVSYLSPAYGGSTSDRQIVERSSLTALCDRGDSIMADKGFNVQDIFAPYDITLNIPTFFRNKNRMSGKTVQRDRKISSKRVHIERVIGLAKTYKILTHPLNKSETKLASEITFVCFMLCNFRQCIIPKDA